MPTNTYYHIVDIDERGEYRARVTDSNNRTVYEYELTEDDSLIDDGYMRNQQDMRGLCEYLIDLGILPQYSRIYGYDIPAR